MASGPSALTPLPAGVLGLLAFLLIMLLTVCYKVLAGIGLRGTEDRLQRGLVRLGLLPLVRNGYDGAKQLLC